MRKLPILALTGLVLLTGCGSSNTSPASPSALSLGPAGQVRVLYAGSLTNLMEHDLGGQYTTASGVQVNDTPAGSGELANIIKGKVKPADVFISADPTANNGLIGKANGDWESWYATFATSPLMLGYIPGSKFAKDLQTKPWNQVVTEPGFQLGSTDPKLDPKGQLATQAMRQEGIDPGVLQVFPEEQLIGRLKAGQLDAGFFYNSEIIDAGIQPVEHTGLNLMATYTLSVLNRAPDQQNAISFVQYLLGDAGQFLLSKHGLFTAPIQVAGDTSAVPPALRAVLGVH